MDLSFLLERTGPSISPITFPGAGDLVVTEGFRTALEKSGLTGFTFLPVIKHHIVDLNWEDWDISSREPAHYPESGEPENYILTEEHSQKAADALGSLSELVLHDGLNVERDDIDVRLLVETWDGTDFFRAQTTRINCVSAKARYWLEQHFADYVAFQPLN